MEVPSRVAGRGAGKHRRGSGKAGVRGLAVRGEVGFWRTRRGGSCWRNRGLELETREELLEELWSLLGGEK